MSDTSFDDIASRHDDIASQFDDFASQPVDASSQFDDIGYQFEGFPSFSELPTPTPSTPSSPTPPFNKSTFIETVLAVLDRPNMADDARSMASSRMVAKKHQVTPVERAAASLRAACSGGYTALVELLLKKYRALHAGEFRDKILNGQDKDGAGPLYLAAFVGHASVVEVLLAQEGIDPNLMNGKDWTPFRAALSNDNADAAELLAEDDRVIVTTEHHINWNPLCHAASAGYIHIVNLILGRDDANNSVADELDLQDGEGLTALYSASANGHIRVVKSLLGAGASVGQESKGYLMPLYGAANAGHARIVELLLDRTADPTPRTHEGDSALDAAVKAGHAVVAELLMDAISKRSDRSE